MSESPLNIELFQKVRNRIATIPESYDQSKWCTDSQEAPGGTAACLAGETIICAAPSVKAGIKRLRDLAEGDGDGVPFEAARLLGLPAPVYTHPYNESALLFFAHAYGWPEPFRTQFLEGEEAEAAVALIDHIIETGKVIE